MRFKVDVIEAWQRDADDSLVKHVNRLRSEGRANWLWDPEVQGVLGLCPVDKPGTALVIIYADGDWEVSSELEEAIDTGFIQAAEEDV